MDKYENFIKELISKQLEKHGVDFDYVLKNQTIDGELWSNHFTCTPEEADQLKEWAISEMRKRFKWSKKLSQAEYSLFNGMYGLRESTSRF